MIKVDLGCGSKKRDGFVGIDIKDGDDVDIVVDMSRKLPFGDNTVEEIYCHHVLEHIDRKFYAGLFYELWRVCAPGARLDFRFPYWTHRTAYNFSHITRLNEHCFEGPGFQQYFEIEKVEYTWEDEWADKTEEEREYARKHLMNTVKQMRIVFRPRKDEAGRA